MNKIQDSFRKAIQQSRVLTTWQKEELLADPPFPDEYRKKIAKILKKFDNNSKAREAYLRDKLEVLYTEFIGQLEAEGVEEAKKNEMMEKVRKQIEGFFPKDNQS